MKHLLWILIVLFLVSTSYAGDEPGSSEVSDDFAEAMGLDQMLTGIMEQTRSSMLVSIKDLSQNIRAQLPELSAEQEETLEGIFKDYINQIIDSVDPEMAAEIYTSTISGGLPVEEIEAATEYYSSPEGQKLLIVVNEAAQNMNQYVLDQIMSATKEAQVVLIENIGEFSADVRSGSN